MAIVEKTIEYAFPMTTATVADKTVTNLTQVTVEIPEASPTFVSVFVDVGFQDIITGTGGTISEHRVGLRLNAAGYTTFTDLDDIGNTAENVALLMGPYDFTSHFTTNWTGTSATCDLQVYFDQSTGTTLGMANVTARLYITYSYDDTAATQIKTVRIPLESLVGALPTTATNFGTDQIPQLTGGGILPEASPVIVDWFLVIEGNEATSAATPFTLSANIDGGATTNFMTQEAALQSARFCRWFYKPTVPTTTTTHNLQLWADLALCNTVTVTLVVTYKFTLSGTTRTLASLLIPWELPSPLGNTTSADASRFARTVIVPEPGTITLRQSGYRLNWNAEVSTGSFFTRAGAQAYRTNTPPANLVYCGMLSTQQRIDSGAAEGVGVASFGAGENNLVIDAYGTQAASNLTNLNGYVLLNYECDVPSQGIGAASHVIIKAAGALDVFTTTTVKYTGQSLGITPANYWLTAAGLCVYTAQIAAGNGLVVSAEVQSGEGAGAGWRDLYADAYRTDGELGATVVWATARDEFKRCPQDADTDRMDIETARDFVVYSGATSRLYGMLLAATVHHVTYTVGGTISGNDAALTTDLQCCRAATGEVMQRQTLAAGVTSYSFTVYENDQAYYVDAYQDATHVGRSAEALPT